MLLQQLVHLLEEARKLGQHVSCYCLEMLASYWTYVQFLIRNL